VETSADQEIGQIMLPGEKVGPLRSTPYDQLPITTSHPIFGDIGNPEYTGIPLEELDAEVQQRGAIVLTHDEEAFEELRRLYEGSSPEFFHALEELYKLMFEEFDHEQPNAIAYLIISKQQESGATQMGTKRVQLLITWDQQEIDDQGRIVMEDGEAVVYRDENGNAKRMASAVTAYINEQSEWHEH
jgi:hypothetical protein